MASKFLIFRTAESTKSINGWKSAVVKMCWFCLNCLVSVCNQQIPHLIELRKVLGQEQLVILATSNETAKYLKNFAAAKGVNFAVATEGSGPLPVLFCDVRPRPTTIFTDRIGIFKLAA